METTGETEAKTDETAVQTSAEPRLRVLKNGAVYDNVLKKIVKGADLSNGKASEIAKKRWEDYYADYEAGAMEGVGVATTGEVVRRVAKATAKRAVDTSDKSQLQAARDLLGRMFGEPDEVGGSGEVKLTASIPLEAVPMLAETLALARGLRKPPEVVDVTPETVEETDEDYVE